MFGFKLAVTLHSSDNKTVHWDHEMKVNSMKLDYIHASFPVNPLKVLEWPTSPLAMKRNMERVKCVQKLNAWSFFCWQKYKPKYFYYQNQGFMSIFRIVMYKILLKAWCVFFHCCCLMSFTLPATGFVLKTKLALGMLVLNALNHCKHSHVTQSAVSQTSVYQKVQWLVIERGNALSSVNYASNNYK